MHDSVVCMCACVCMYVYKFECAEGVIRGEEERQGRFP